MDDRHQVMTKAHFAFVFIVFSDRLKMWQFFSNEVSFIWLRPPTHPSKWKCEK